MGGTRLRLGEDLSNACLREADCPDLLVIYGRGQASPFLAVHPKEKPESLVCSFEYAKYAVMPDTEKPR